MDILYTTSEAVTAALGLTDRDLKEEQFESMDLERELRVDLYRWLPDHADIAAYADLPSPTDAQLYQYDLLVLASKYFCASRVSESLALSAPQAVTSESGNSMDRIMFDPATVRDAMVRGYNLAKTRLIDAITPPTTQTRTSAITAVGSAYDPYTAPS